ncbi:hypothetical protein ACFWP2_19430 [Kitasatospora sp. NPDC058444]|uniref:hypothetical protein n=1 Tax=Kitasatospora sp. NPDC058444 TaxID=3346504 RepID=UPI00365F9F3F
MAGKNTEPGEPNGIGDRPQDDFVTRNLASPSERPARALTLSGLLGDSDRAGYRRLYFNKQLDYYAEFASADVLSVETVGGDQPPFVGLDATKVTLRRDATVHFTRVESATPVDDFDLDLRLGQPQGPGAVPQTVGPQTVGPLTIGPDTLPTRTAGAGGCIAVTDFGCATDFDCPTVFNTGCRPQTCQCTEDTACVTRFPATCRTCDTCGENTCDTCRESTCLTCAACRTQVTCDTCVTCGEGCATRITCDAICATATRITCDAVCATATRITCDAICATATRITCACPGAHVTGVVCRTRDTCNPHVFTCGPDPQC